MSGSSIEPTWLLTVMRPRPGARASAAAMRSPPSPLVRAPAARNSLQAPPTPASTRCCRKGQGAQVRCGAGQGASRQASCCDPHWGWSIPLATLKCATPPHPERPVAAQHRRRALHLSAAQRASLRQPTGQRLGPGGSQRAVGGQRAAAAAAHKGRGIVLPQPRLLLILDLPQAQPRRRPALLRQPRRSGAAAAAEGHACMRQSIRLKRQQQEAQQPIWCGCLPLPMHQAVAAHLQAREGAARVVARALPPLLQAQQHALLGLLE